MGLSARGPCGLACAVSVCIAFATFTAQVWAESSEALAILNSYREHTERFPNWSLTAETETIVSGAVSVPNFERKRATAFQYLKRNSDTDILRHDPGAKRDGVEMGARTVSLAEDIFSLKLINGHYLDKMVLEKRERVKGTGRDGPNLNGGEWLDGHLAREGAHAADLLQQAPDLAVRGNEVIDGHPCAVVTGTVPGRGSYTLWISPDHGHAALRAVVEKRGNDLYFDKPISESYPAPPEGAVWTPNFPDDRYTLVRLEMEDVELLEVGGNWIPSACKVKITQVYPNGEQTVFEYRHVRSEIELEPDFVALGGFELALKEGATVNIIGVPGITYKYTKAGVTPIVDESISE